MLPTTLLYAGLLGLLMSVLSIRVPIRRGILDVPFGDGDDLRLATRIRAFGNFTEYVPMILLLMALLEVHEAPPAMLHAMGGVLLGARLLHAVAYVAKTSLNNAEKIGRGIAAMSTWLVLTAGAIGALAVVST